MNAVSLDTMTPLRRPIVERALALAQEPEAAAGSAPDGQVIDRRESLLLGNGRESLRRALEDALQARAEALEEGGRPAGPALVAPPAATKGGRRRRTRPPRATRSCCGPTSPAPAAAGAVRTSTCSASMASRPTR